MLKTCPDCKETLFVESFGSSKSRYDGKQTYCKDCSAKQARMRYAKNSEAIKARMRIRWYERKYGITYQKKIDMFNEQNGLCAICEVKMDLDNKCHVDHDHTTGAVRGLLCNKCNSGLHYVENKNYYEKAKEYLKNYETIRT